MEWRSFCLSKWKRLGLRFRLRVRRIRCRYLHRKHHFCLDDMCYPVLPGRRVHNCGRCGRNWKTENPRHFQSMKGADEYLEARILGEFRSSGHYEEEDKSGAVVRHQQPFDRREK